MIARMKSLGIDRLSRDEQIELVHEICENLEEDPREALTDEQKKEIERRLAEYEANPSTGVAWDVVEAEALARIRK